jgi:hypothetical protein
MKKAILPIALMLLFVYSNAQLALTNSGNFQVHAGGVVSGLGNFTNSSTGVLVNNGSFYIQGNITNDQASMANGTGILYMNGSGVQSVNGSQPLKTFDFVSNNAAGITINNNLHIGGAHTFTSGMITTSSTPNYLVYEAGSSYSGNSDARHVNGWVKKIGTTNFTFPVGDATYERAAGISNLSGAAEINCHFYRNTQNIYNLNSPLVAVDSNEYWQLNKISGGTMRVVLNWAHPKVSFYNVLLGWITSANYNGSNWDSTGGTASGVTTGTGNITSDVVSTLGPFTFGYKSQPVPLKLISFTGERKTNMTLLKWITESEENVDYFDVQRSDDGNIYTSLGHVPARNSYARESYNLEDYLPLYGIAYYRLRSVDKDGRSSYSHIVAISETGLLPANLYVENPSHTSINVFNKTGKQDVFNYRLFTLGGTLMMKGNLVINNNGSTPILLPLQVTTGVYVLELTNGKTFVRQKILVEK